MRIERDFAHDNGDWDEMLKLNPIVKDLARQIESQIPELVKAGKRWHAINNKWKGVPNVVQL